MMIWLKALGALSGFRIIAIAVAVTVGVGALSVGLSSVKRSGAMESEFQRVIEINEQNLAEKEHLVQALETANDASEKARIAVAAAEQRAKDRIAVIRNVPKSEGSHTCTLDSLVPSLFP